MKIADALKLKIGDWIAPRRDFVMEDDGVVAFKARTPYRILCVDSHPNSARRDSVSFGLRSEITPKRYGTRGPTESVRMHGIDIDDLHGMDIDDLRTFDKVESPFKRKTKR